MPENLIYSKPFQQGEIVKVIAEHGADEGFFVGMMGRVVEDFGDGWVGVRLKDIIEDTDFQQAELRAASAEECDVFLDVGLNEPNY